MNGKFNLSEWALKHQSFVWYLMFVAVVAGIFSYINLGRAEDPSFAIKTMVIQSKWPGATVDETRLQITDRIEKKLEELDSLDYVQSYTSASTSGIEIATTSPARRPRLIKLTASTITTASNSALVKPLTATSTTCA